MRNCDDGRDGDEGTDNGYIQFTTYSGPDCTGTVLSVYNFCSIGATSTGCIDNTAMHLTTSELLAQWDAVRLALSENLRAAIYGNTCIGGSGFCAGYIELASN